MCNRWQQGRHCAWGRRCHFAHGAAELQDGVAAAFTRALTTHNAAQLHSSNVRDARGSMQGAYPSSGVPKHEVPCKHFMRGDCRMGAACGFKHDVVA